MPIEIITERPGLVLRQFAAADSLALFALIDRNRAHLSQYRDDTARKYPDHASVLRSITHPENGEKLRFGVWDGEVLVGTVNLIPRRNDEVVLGYWLGSQFTGNGYATMAATTLCGYAAHNLGARSIVAVVHERSFASQEVLRRCGFGRGSETFGGEPVLIFEKKCAPAP